MRTSRLLIGLLASVLAAGFGCKSSTPKPPPPGPKFTFTVRPDDSLAGAEFEVNMLLVNPSTRPEIEAVDVGDYFDPNNRTRHLPLVLTNYTVTRDNRKPVQVKLTDKQRFPNYSDFVVIANFPFEVRSGKDERRKFIPLDSLKWRPGTRKVEVTITRGGIRTDPGPVQ